MADSNAVKAAREAAGLAALEVGKTRRAILNCEWRNGPEYRALRSLHEENTEDLYRAQKAVITALMHDKRH